jgi:prepilin-type N-terminal cleavage/methylation domain-containing protein/prepilin-type processing-associated H-X9-DG protein
MKWRAFTLLELLVVIAVIALLLAILTPALRNSKRHTKALLCRSNIKQLHIGLTIYENENNVFPYSFNQSLSSLLTGDSSYERIGLWWLNYITDYSENQNNEESILWCPSRQIDYPRYKYNVLIGNYGVNQSICKSNLARLSQSIFVGTPLSSSEIQNPSRTLLLVDSGYSMINWWHAADEPPVSFGSLIEDNAYIPGLSINRNKILRPGREKDGIYGRHPNKTVNVGFVDGHVDRVKAESLLVEKTVDGYKNCKPLWQPN